jgi:hypothetical protein
MATEHKSSAFRAGSFSWRLSKISGLAAVILGVFLLTPPGAVAQSGSAVLAWSPSLSPTVAGYMIRFGAASGVYTSELDAGLTLTETITGLVPGQTNYFVVAAYENDGLENDGLESLPATEVAFRPPVYPSILAQPLNQMVIAGSPVAVSVSALGDAPLSFQWVDGLTAVSGATNPVLAWSPIQTANAGNYAVIVSNSWGSTTSVVATVTVLATNAIATAAGVYNGLFFQTNLNGTSDVTESTAGFLGNCIVSSNGTFSATFCVGGVSYPASGGFDVFGNTIAAIPRTGPGLSGLTAVLSLNLITGTQQISGTVSSTTAGVAWTASLAGVRATNSYPTPVAVSLLAFPAIAVNSPTNFGWATGSIVNGVLSLSGLLGDSATVSQTVPISSAGWVPIYASLYTNSGLVEGWLNLAGSNVTGSLTWIRPPGIVLPVGFPGGFSNIVPVAGGTFGPGVGYIGASGPGTYVFGAATISTSGWIVFQDAGGVAHYRQTGYPMAAVIANSSLTFWACAGYNNPRATGVITAFAISQSSPTLTSIDVSALGGLQTFAGPSMTGLASLNASGCLSLTSLCCDYCDAVAVMAMNNCGALTSVSRISGNTSVSIQNATIAALPFETTGAHTFYLSQFAPINPAGDAAAATKGWTVNRLGG